MPLIESVEEAARYLDKYGYRLEQRRRRGEPVENQYRIICKRPDSTFRSRSHTYYDLGDLQILCEGIRRDHFQTILNDRP